MKAGAVDVWPQAVVAVSAAGLKRMGAGMARWSAAVILRACAVGCRACSDGRRPGDRGATGRGASDNEWRSRDW